MTKYIVVVHYKNGLAGATEPLSLMKAKKRKVYYMKRKVKDKIKFVTIRKWEE